MDGNITEEGIYKDLLWMNRIGIGGFHQFDASLYTKPIVKERLVYMTPKWKKAFRYAIHLADSLNMEVGIASAPGWSSTGGPRVNPKNAMKKPIAEAPKSRVAGRHFAIDKVKQSENVSPSE